MDLYQSFKIGLSVGAGILCIFSVAYAAISWPSAPAGEVSGGKYSARLVPSGFIGAFNLATCPTGWTLSDGSAGTLDLRGEFLRGMDNGRNIDTPRTLGSAQGDTIRNITGDILGVGSWGISAANIGLITPKGSLSQSNVLSVGGTNVSPTLYFDASRSVPTSNENRPRNVAVLYCQKN